MQYSAPKIPNLMAQKTQDGKFQAMTEYMYAVQKMMQVVLNNLGTDNMTKDVSTVVSDIVSAAKGVNGSVSKGGFASYVSQTAEKITQKVVSGDIVSAINLSKGLATIEAQKINLTGYVSINEYFRIDTDGKFTANAGNIAGFLFEPNKGLYFGTNSANVSPSLYFGAYNLLKAVSIAGSAARADWRFKIGANAGFTADGSLYCNSGYYRGNVDAKAIQYGAGNTLSGSALANNSVTETQMESAYATLKGNVNALMGFPVLLWTNPNPTSVFDPQTVSIDLSSYSFVRIAYTPSNVSSHSGIWTAELQRGDDTILNGCYYCFTERAAEVTETGVIFGAGGRYDGAYGSSTLTTYRNGCVPLKIWGVK